MKKLHYAWWGYIKNIIRVYPVRREVELQGVAQHEQEAVQAAIDATEQMTDGSLRLKVVRLVLWDRTHTLEGAARIIPCSRSWAAKWQRDFFEAVARNRNLLD